MKLYGCVGIKTYSYCIHMMAGVVLCRQVSSILHNLINLTLLHLTFICGTGWSIWDSPKGSEMLIIFTRQCRHDGQHSTYAQNTCYSTQMEYCERVRLIRLCCLQSTTPAIICSCRSRFWFLHIHIILLSNFYYDYYLYAYKDSVIFSCVGSQTCHLFYSKATQT